MSAATTSARSRRRPQVNAQPRLDRTTFATSRLLDFCSAEGAGGADRTRRRRVAAGGRRRSCSTTRSTPARKPTSRRRSRCASTSAASRSPTTGRACRQRRSRPFSTSAPGPRSARPTSRPTRGAQGNALKTLSRHALRAVRRRRAAAWSRSRAQGQRHRIEFAVDQLRQQPAIRHTVEPSSRNVGTEVLIAGRSSKLNSGRRQGRFLQIADDFTWLNPHLTLRVDWFGETRHVAATDPGWSKWKPVDPTSPHWYTPERLARLIAAYVVDDATTGGRRAPCASSSPSSAASPAPRSKRRCSRQPGWRGRRCRA